MADQGIEKTDAPPPRETPAGPDSAKYEERAKLIFIILAGIFVGALVTTNLIANKFVRVDLHLLQFTISAGVLAYPVTFLVTDILSEIYGRRRTNQVVLSGFVVSLFVLFFLWLGSHFPAIEDSPVDDATYDQVFSSAWRVIGASMIAYLSAQFIDVKMFHFWKRRTGGRHLWFRNNASTVVSQLVDTTLVISVLFVGVLSAEEMGRMVIDGWIFKALVALFDTALIYLFVFWIRRLLRLGQNEEARL